MKKSILILLLGLAIGAGAAIYLYLNPSEAFDETSEIHVYETEVDGPSDCASFEIYDATQKVCSFECSTENECSDLQKQADEEFADWTDELEKDRTPVAEKKITEDSDKVATYSVNPTEKILLINGQDKPEYQAIWNEIKSLSPDYISDKYIDSYEVFNNTSDDTLAFVADDDGNGKWTVGINLAGYTASTKRENKMTIIHELGHIISLNSSQVSPDVDTCPNLVLDEGCANKNSVINIFWSKYWRDIDEPEFDQNKFVTEYAATSETEDFAETFAFFVLEKDSGFGNSIKDQKIKSLYSHPELVEIRKQMRSTLVRDVIRARK